MYPEKKKRNRWMLWIVFPAVVIVPAIWMTWNVVTTQTINCEVCIRYGPGSQCRKATASDRYSCQRTATDNACAFLAQGMTQSIECSQTPPKSVRFF